jgi:hypothetical protein
MCLQRKRSVVTIACMSVLLSQLNKLIPNAQLAARGNVLRRGMRFAFILHAARGAAAAQTSDRKVTQSTTTACTLAGLHCERSNTACDLGTLRYYPWYRAAAALERDREWSLTLQQQRARCT